MSTLTLCLIATEAQHEQQQAKQNHHLTGNNSNTHLASAQCVLTKYSLAKITFHVL